MAGVLVVTFDLDASPAGKSRNEDERAIFLHTIVGDIESMWAHRQALSVYVDGF